MSEMFGISVIRISMNNLGEDGQDFFSYLVEMSQNLNFKFGKM